MWPWLPRARQPPKFVQQNSDLLSHFAFSFWSPSAVLETEPMTSHMWSEGYGFIFLFLFWVGLYQIVPYGCWDSNVSSLCKASTCSKPPSHLSNGHSNLCSLTVFSWFVCIIVGERIIVLQAFKWVMYTSYQEYSCSSYIGFYCCYEWKIFSFIIIFF